MFQDYKKLVVITYRKKLADGTLSNNLADPSPAKIREECLLVYTSRYKKETDNKTLETFFGHSDERGDYRPIIYNFKVSLFKPLSQFLRDLNRDPNTINIELLAWLIDYQPRPFRFDPLKKTEEEPISRQPPRSGSTEVPGCGIPTITWKEWIKNYRNESIVAFVILGIIIALVINIIPKKQCMYWSGDHYEAIACDQQLFGVQSIALDTMKLNNFRRITKPDTMTTYSVGKVWYVKIGKNPDCFTADGNHPLYPGKDLRRLSLHMLREYFGKKATDSLTGK